MPGLMIEPDDICLYVTEKCNSNCIMCPMSFDSRRRGRSMRGEGVECIFEGIPPDAKHITITGGEPFLEFDYVFRIMEKINEKCPETEVLILSNGRAFSIQALFDRLQSVLTEKYCIAVPIHAASQEIHDVITQSSGSFVQTVSGLKNLSKTCAKIEIRIVGHRLNYKNISQTFMQLASSQIRIDVINLVAMEMSGCAAKNREKIWVEYKEIVLAAEKGIAFAITNGIDVGLYNFPLCSIPERLWGLAKNSITPTKVRFDLSCQECAVKAVCGGLFHSTYMLNLNPINPIQR